MHIVKHIHKFNMLKRRLMGGSSGMMLIGLVITMIILAILGAVIVQLFSTASMHEVSVNLAHKAQYMAESGYRYAASQYRNMNTGDDKDNILIDVNSQTYSLTPDPLNFTLNVGSYFYKYNNSNTVEAFPSVPAGITDHTGSGKAGIFTTGFLTDVVTYSDYSKAATSITFTPSGTWPSTGSLSKRLFPIVSPLSTAGNQPVTLSPAATLQLSNDDLSLLPATNGPFRIYKEDKMARFTPLLQYRELDTTNKRLVGISRINGEETDITFVAPTDYIVLQRFINLDSTGKAGDDTSNIFASRKLSYQVPVEAFPPSNPPPGGGLDTGDKNIFDIPLDDPKLMNDPEFTVSPDIKTSEAVIQATGTSTADTRHGITYNPALSLNLPPPYLCANPTDKFYPCADPYDHVTGDNVHVNINWWRFVDRGLGLNFDQAYHVQGDLLSYDMQLKVRTWESPTLHHFMVGLSFRMIDNDVGFPGNQYYGVSLFRSQLEPDNKLGNYPPWLGIPQSQGGAAGYRLANLAKNTVFVVFWKRVDGTITLLHDQVVSDAAVDPYNDPTYWVDWASLVVRLEETQVSGTKTNNFKIVVYDNGDNANTMNRLGTFRWPTEVEWGAISALSDSSITTQGSLDEDGLPGIPRPTQNPPDSGNYLEGCESCTSCASPGVCGRPEIGVHAFADVNADQKIYVDDLAIKLLGGGGPAGGDVGFQPPVYTQ